MEIKLFEVEHKSIAKYFTKENEKKRLLEKFFYLDNRRMRRLDTCDKFVESYGYCKRIFVMQESEETIESKDVLSIILTPTDSRSVAKWVSSKDYLFFAKKDSDEKIYHITNSYTMVEMIKEDAKFFEMQI